MKISEIAARANVSIATVSRVLNNTGSVSEKTRSRVMAVITQSGMVEDLNLSIPTSKKILMCVPSFNNPFNGNVFEGVLASAAVHDYQVFFHKTTVFSGHFSDYSKIFAQGCYAGIIVQSPVIEPTFLDELSTHYPVVMCSEHCDKSNISYVSIDNKAAAHRAVSYLLSIGRKKIAMINSSLDKHHSTHREIGYRQALTQANIPINESWIVHISSIDYSLGVSYASHLLTLPDRPDAIFANSDVYAAAAINAAKSLGLRVPQDVAVIGFDDIDIAAISHPSITTVRQPTFDIGYQACELLINQIEHSSDDVKHLILDTELIIREST